MKNMFKKFLIGTLAVVAFVITANLALASYDFGSAILKVGSKGQYVTTLQNLVGATPVDGIFGPKTKAKVVAWQNAHDLIADGLFGKLSKAKANGAVSGNFPAGCTNASGFSTVTGIACTSAHANIFPVGCSNASGFSTVTGIACSSLSAHTFPAGCTNASGFSTTTGYLCLTGLPTTTTPIVRGGGSSGSSHHHTSVTAIGAITGTLTVGATLTAGAVTPSGATVDYQWQRGDIAGGLNYPDILGATSSTYTILAGDVGKYFDVTATGTDHYSGSVKSAATAVVTPADIATAGITGFVAPVLGATPQVFGTLTAGGAIYSVTGLTWSPAHNPYQESQAYTATVTLTSAAGYKFPVAGIAVPTANTGTVSAGTTTGGDITGNTLSYTVLFPATAAPAPVIATNSTITSGANGATIVVTGTNFKSDIVPGDLIVGDHTNGSLSFSGVTYTSGTQITVSLAGTVGSSGYVTIQARASAFNPAGTSVSNELTVNVTVASLNPVTSAVFTTTSATTTITIILTQGSFKDTIVANDFTFGGLNETAIKAGTFTKTDATHVIITGLGAYFTSRVTTDNDNTVTVLGATQATQATKVDAVAS